MSRNLTYCMQITHAFVCPLRICQTSLNALDIEIEAGLVKQVISLRKKYVRKCFFYEKNSYCIWYST